MNWACGNKIPQCIQLSKGALDYLWPQVFTVSYLVFWNVHILGLKKKAANWAWITTQCQLPQVHYIFYLSWRHCQATRLLNGSELDFLLLMGSYQKNVMMLFASHWLENIRSVSHMMCEKNQRRLFNCCVNVPLSSICLSWLSLSVPSVGCFCLPVSACACHLSIIFSMSLSPLNGLLHCPVWTNFLPLCAVSPFRRSSLLLS